jgi:hypothetical protein
VHRFFVEAENGSGLLIYGLKDGLLEINTRAFAAPLDGRTA